MYQKFLEQGNYEFKQGKYKSAINSYELAIACNPQSIEAYYGCGLAAEKIGKQTLARDCSTTVAKLEAECLTNASIPRLSINEKLIILETQRDKSQIYSSFGERILYLILVLIVAFAPSAICYVAQEIFSQDRPEIDSQIVHNFNNTL